MRSLFCIIVIMCGCVCPPQPITRPQLPEITKPEQLEQPEQPEQPKPQYSLEEVQQEIAALKFLQGEIAKQEEGLLESVADGDKYYSFLGEKTRIQLKGAKMLLAYIISLKEDLKRRLVRLQEIEANLQSKD